MNQKRMSMVKNICICAVCIALCYVLPLAFHAIGAGTVFLPMHIPVLLCGLLCGWLYGGICGIIGPLVSHLFSGMPPAPALVSMVPELCVYGVVCGLMMRFVRTKNHFADLYISMITAMLLGRVVGGVAKAIFFSAQGNTFSFTVWATSYFVEGLPGILIQLALIPALVFALTKARLVPDRYPKK